MKNSFLALLLTFSVAGLSAQGDSNWSLLPEEHSDTVISLIFAGDIMGHSQQYKAAYNADTEQYNYDVCFENVKPYIEDADFAVANLEAPVAGAPYSGYPNFSSPDALLDALKNAGYDVLLTANNHVADRGAQGVRRTIEQIQNRKFKYAGSYLDAAQKDSIYPLLLEKNDFKIALLNYTYGTNGIPVNKPLLVNTIDTDRIVSDLKKAEQLADFTVVCIHWGTEYELQANASQRKLAETMVANGADLIIGAHPHVVQNAELMINKDKVKIPVFYSVGNSISNQRKVNTNGGIMVSVKIGAKSGRILETTYLPVYVHRGTLNGVYQFHLIPTPDFIANPAKFKIAAADSAALTVFDRNTRERLEKFSVVSSQKIQLRIKN
ncbi:MAG: CapA family protein [Prevotellaceae bacterium]|jgi:poly-gamma-glutamate synthesis protein (capsule biosynthesis protein)|nr:CapA family protein [Prevotellaceae bacterium]